MRFFRVSGSCKGDLDPLPTSEFDQLSIVPRAAAWRQKTTTGQYRTQGATRQPWRRTETHRITCCNR